MPTKHIFKTYTQKEKKSISIFVPKKGLNV